MKTKESKKDPVGKETGTVSIDPFESIAESPSQFKRRVKKPDGKSAVTAKPVKRITAKTASVDAFDAPVVEAVAVPSSPVKKRATAAKTKAVKTAAKPAAARRAKTKAAGLDVATVEVATEKREVEVSQVFKALAEPILPVLEKENRARLLMQSPTKLYFYWSVKENPYQLLRDAFGSDTGSYVLVLKLSDLTNGVETMHQAEAEGNWWFDVRPDTEYEAEIGFYAPNRPYFRIIYSNTITTPRRSPSPRTAAEATWTVSANKFAEVLDVSGFSQDAFDVALAGDDHYAADDATLRAFTALTGAMAASLSAIASEDMRRAMVALASGQKLEEMRWQISPELFAVLQASSSDLNASKARSVLSENFDIDESEFTEEQFGPAVHGASLVHFPRTLKTRPARRYSPVSSSTLRA